MSVAYALEAQREPAARRTRGPVARADGRLDAQRRRRACRRASLAALELQPGERIVSVSAGGGGYGDPLTRDPVAVMHDVREGWVSRERAREVYGVAPTGANEIDEAGTDGEGQERDAERRPSAPLARREWSSYLPVVVFRDVCTYGVRSTRRP